MLYKLSPTKTVVANVPTIAYTRILKNRLKKWERGREYPLWKIIIGRRTRLNMCSSNCGESGGNVSGGGR